MSGFLSNIANTFSLTGGDSGVVGIEFSSSAVKVVQLHDEKETPVLDTYGELSFAPYLDSHIGESVSADPETMGEALSDILKEAKVTTSQAGVAIPLSASLINVIDIPPVSKSSRLEEIVPMEARKYIPADPEEVLLDWTLVSEGESEDDGKEALVVAIRKDEINKYQRALEAVELDTDFYEIEIFSSIRSTLDRGIEPKLLVDIGASSSKIYIVEHGVVHGSHRVEQGGEDITETLTANLDLDFAEAEKIKRREGIDGSGENAEAVKEAADNILGHVFSRAGDIVSDYQKTNATVMEEAVLTGGGTVLSGIEAKARDHFEIDVRRADPFSKLKTPAHLADTLRDIGPEFAVSIGAALRSL